jgi:hypothetical protein
MEDVSSIRNLRMRHAVVTGNPLNTDGTILTLFKNNVQAIEVTGRLKKRKIFSNGEWLDICKEEVLTFMTVVNAVENRTGYFRILI